MDNAKLKRETFFRTLTLDRGAADDEARTVPAALSTETEVPRWFGREQLVHDDESVDLGRAADGLPLLFSHNQDQPIGLAENVRLEGGKLRADLRFSRNPKASEIWDDVRDGFLKNISIGYRINTWEESGDSDLVRVTDWTLLEASVVTVPADASAGVHRTIKESTIMEDTTGTRDAGKNTAGSGGPSSTNVIDYQAARESGKVEGITEGVIAERRRIDDINALFTGARFQGPEFSGLRDTLIRNGDNIEHARAELLKLIGQGAEPVAGDRRADEPSFRPGESDDEMDKFARGMEETILIRGGVITDKEARRKVRESEFNGWSVSELAREFLRRRGESTRALSRDGVMKRALLMGVQSRALGHSTSDFDGILENIANKALLVGYDEAPETWSRWAKIGNLADFKAGSRTNVSAFSDLDEVKESGEIPFGTMSDVKESIQLLTFAKRFGVSRQALVNDDLDALTVTPRAMGRAANRKVGDITYAALTANALMDQDGLALFVAGHGNFVASGSGAAPSVTTLDAGFTAMALQTDPSGNGTLNLEPAYLLVPKGLETTARVLATAQNDPTQSSNLANNQPNPFQNRIEVVADSRLDTFLSTGWYLAANGNIANTVEVAFLDGIETPFLESKDGWSVDGVEYKVRIDAVAEPTDYRGLYYNYGA